MRSFPRIFEEKRDCSQSNIFYNPSEPEPTPCVDESVGDTDDTGSSLNSHVFRIQTRQSPYLDMFYAHHPVRVTIDSGATGNMIRHTVIQRLGCQVAPSSQSIHQADGSSPLHVVGETRFPFIRGGHTFIFEGLVVENLDVDVLAGTPFMESNDIAVRPAKRQVILGDGTIHNYGSQKPVSISPTACCAIVLRSSPTSTTVWPGEFLEVELPGDAPPDSVYALEPQTDALSVKKVNSFPTVATADHGLQRRRKNTYPQLNSKALLPQTERTLLSGSCRLHTSNLRSYPPSLIFRRGEGGHDTFTCRIIC